MPSVPFSAPDWVTLFHTLNYILDEYKVNKFQIFKKICYLVVKMYLQDLVTV